jgi:glycosyltransferase involved in cell wall biosynthesis
MLLVIVTTVPTTLNFFRSQVGFLKERGFVVHAVSSPGDELQEFGRREGVPVHAVAMTRAITPLQDLAALFRLVHLFRRLRPTIVHAHTPKGGVLGVLAARLAGVPLVMYTIHGLPFANASGLKRWVLWLSEMASCRGAHRVLGVSQAMRRQALAHGLCPPHKIEVLGPGSINGVDAEGRFNPARFPEPAKRQLRAALGLPSGALVLGYVGRIVKDKGIEELAEAWRELRGGHPDLYLVLVGREEPQDPIAPATRQALRSDPRVVFTGPVADPAPYYAIMDLVVLPTHREGFPMVPLEAAAMGLPVVTTTVDGCPEAVVDGLTGMLVPPRDSPSLTRALKVLISDAEMRKRMGKAARERVLQKFQPEGIWKILFNKYFYESNILRKK